MPRSTTGSSRPASASRRGPGPVDQRAQNRLRPLVAALARPGQRASASFARFLAPSGALHDVGRCRPCPGRGGFQGPAETRSWRSAACPSRSSPAPRRGRWSTRSRPPPHASGPALPRSRRSGLSRPYAGDQRGADGAYHQGTFWPWLIGPFVDAWLGVRAVPAGEGRSAGRFLPPLRPISRKRARPTSRRSPTAIRPIGRRLPVPGLVPRRADPVRRMLDLDPV